MDTPSQTKTEPPALEMADVSVCSLRDPERLAAEGVNWSVMAGDYWVVAGAHGAGKSDFLALAAGLSMPAEGKYFLFGREVVPGYQDEQLGLRLRVGLVFDGGQPFGHLTVEENIALPLRYHRPDTDMQAQVRTLLELTELEPFAKSRPSLMSRSWRQRVGLARALALRPEVLLVDNPLSGLDPRHISWWLGFLNELSRGHTWLDGRPMTIAASTDNLRPWRRRARQFAMLREGRFEVIGTQADLEGKLDHLTGELLLHEAAEK